MFTKKDLLFTEIKQNIKLFLSKFGNKAPGIHDKEYKQALDRYKELTNDLSFQDKLLELSLLETVIVQAYKIQTPKPVIYTNKTSKYPSLYVMDSYPRLNRIKHNVVRALGPRYTFPDKIRVLENNPEFMAKARLVLQQAMEDSFSFETYKNRFLNP